MKQDESEEPQNDSEKLQDDYELEITSLDDVEGDRPVVARLPQKPLLFVRRHRKLATFATTGVVVLALLLLLFSIAPLRQALFPPAEQSTFSYHLDASPPWGHLFVDGKAVSVSSGQSYPLFSLTRGQHTLVWRADPFPPQQCTLSVPVGSGIDTCKHPPIPPFSGTTDSYISFPADIALLSPHQRYALLQATQAVFNRLQSSETVREGELYAQTDDTGRPNLPSCTVLQTAALCHADAHQPLQATLRLQLDTTSLSLSSPTSCAGGACSSEGQNCRLFCAPFFYVTPDLPVSSTLWQVSVDLQLFWQFTTLQGQVIVDNQADTFIRGQQNDISVPLNVTWNGRQWSVSIDSIDYVVSGDPVCDAAMHDLYNLESAIPVTAEQNTVTSMNPVQGTTFASGCLIEFELQNATIRTVTPNVSPPLVADVMQRFGVLLAVNDEAHRLFPFLPVANAYEKQLAQLWTDLQSGDYRGAPL